MNIRFANKVEVRQWNTHIISNPDNGNVFQGYEFAEQKKMGGWTPRFIFIDRLAVTILEKTVFGLGHLWYMPKGPGLTSTRTLDSDLQDLKEFAHANGVFCIKIEPELPKTPENTADLMKLGLIKVTPIQPNFSTVTIDISPDIQTILASLNQKGRHAIKRAERDGVVVQQVPSSKENCQTMYTLLAETARGSFRIRHPNYYRSFWQRYSRANLGQLFFAYVDDRIVAGAYALILGEKSTYKDGASVRKRTAYGASHLLQWHVITWAKEQGALVHDLCGVPPSNSIQDPTHPHYGIGRFKTSFNKEVTDYVGAYDIIINPIQYKIWSSVGERIVTKIHRTLNKENYY